MRTRPRPDLPERSASPAVELVWPGKRGGSTAEAAAPSLEPVERYGAERTRWTNKLVHADNLAAMRALLPKFAGKVDLVYIDPPFATGADFRLQADVGDGGRAVRRVLDRIAYRDAWRPERWLGMLYERLALVRELMSERGTLYLHLDWALGHHVRPLLDEVFGPENSLGEIIWAYGSPSGGRAAGQKLVKAHDTIFVFARQYGRHRFRPLHLPYSERYVRDWFKYQDDDGRRYRKRWRRDAAGRSYSERQYLDESPGVPVSTVWTDIQQVYADPRAYREGTRSEVTGFPTQKPLKLLERILEISSEPGDLVADFFCGSGTTIVAAERLGRRWIGCDAGGPAIHTARRRLLETGPAPSFEILSLTRGEHPRARVDEDALRRKLLQAYGARPLPGDSELHGRRGRAFVRVGALSTPVREGEVAEGLRACRAAGGRELHVLGREWDFDAAAERLERMARRLRVAWLPVQIPTEALPDSERHDLAFVERPILEAALRQKAGKTFVELRSFEYRRPKLLPEEARRSAGRWLELLDWWAVDFDFDGAVFRPTWSGGRTRHDRVLPLASEAVPRRKLGRRVAVVAVDVLGQQSLRILKP